MALIAPLGPIYFVEFSELANSGCNMIFQTSDWVLHPIFPSEEFIWTCDNWLLWMFLLNFNTIGTGLEHNLNECQTESSTGQEYTFHKSDLGPD